MKWLIEKMANRMMDKAQEHMSAKTVWLLLAMIGVVMYVLTMREDVEPDGAADELIGDALLAASDEDLAAELDRRTKSKGN